MICPRSILLVCIICLWVCYKADAQLDRTNIDKIIAQLKNTKYNKDLSLADVKTVKNISEGKNKYIIKYHKLNKKINRKNKDYLDRLDRPCFTDKDCDPETDHVCTKNVCQCRSSYVRQNATHCLPGTLLGFSCRTHSQCSIRVDHSSCIQGFCRCGAGTVPYRRANCLPAAFLGESCRTHSQCSMATERSHCKWIVNNVWGQCQCKPEVPRRGDKCGPPGFALGAPCGKSFDCAQHVPGSICVGILDRAWNDTQETPNLVHPATLEPYQNKNLKEERFIANLGGICQCPEGYLVIKNNSRCVPVKKEIGVNPVSLGKPCLFSSQCRASDPYSFCNDGTCDCLVQTPECSAKNAGCFGETFQCISDGRCLSADFVCDGKHHCNDGSDEASCVPGRCSSLSFLCADGSCVARGLVCDGRIDCPDGSDENKCIAKRSECPATAFRCKDGQCLPGFTFCNSFTSCRDKSDEDVEACVGGIFRVPFCPFRCKNGRCRSTSILCSGKDGCGDGSDEDNCSVCSCPLPHGKENNIQNVIKK